MEFISVIRPKTDLKGQQKSRHSANTLLDVIFGTRVIYWSLES